MKGLLIGVAACALTGCAVFSPYDSKFMCSATDDYGRCTDVDGAYDEALAGHKNREAKTRTKERAKDPVLQDASYSAYKTAEYRELRNLIDEPITPLVRPPKVLRTLITAYPSSDRTLYTPRYVFFIADEGQFVLGDYLNALAPPEAVETLAPVGAH